MKVPEVEMDFVCVELPMMNESQFIVTFELDVDMSTLSMVVAARAPSRSPAGRTAR